MRTVTKLLFTITLLTTLFGSTEDATAQLFEDAFLLAPGDSACIFIDPALLDLAGGLVPSSAAASIGEGVNLGTENAWSLNGSDFEFFNDSLQIDACLEGISAEDVDANLSSFLADNFDVQIEFASKLELITPVSYNGSTVDGKFGSTVIMREHNGIPVPVAIYASVAVKFGLGYISLAERLVVFDMHELIFPAEPALNDSVLVDLTIGTYVLEGSSYDLDCDVPTLNLYLAGVVDGHSTFTLPLGDGTDGIYEGAFGINLLESEIETSSCGDSAGKQLAASNSHSHVFLNPSAGGGFNLLAQLSSTGNGDGTETVTGGQIYSAPNPSVTASENDLATPNEFALLGNYPNPFNPTTAISFRIDQAQEVALKVFNTLGQEVATIAAGRFSAGEHTVSFNAEGLSTGLYLYRLITPAGEVTRKMVLLR